MNYVCKIIIGWYAGKNWTNIKKGSSGTSPRCGRLVPDINFGRLVLESNYGIS